MNVNPYILIRNITTKKYFRFPQQLEKKIPFGFEKVYKHKDKIDKFVGADVYDKDGFLLPQYWAVRRKRPLLTKGVTNG